MVYIDNYNTDYKNMKMSHMIADTDSELYDMVDKIGVDRKWKHNDHYDVCKSKKQLAIKHGAVEIKTLELARIWYLKKMRKHKKIKPVPLETDLNNLRNDVNYFNNEKEKIREFSRLR